jgi:hypothetical protein
LFQGLARIFANRSSAIGRALLTGALLALLNVAALAQLARTIPAEAGRGTVTHISELVVAVNGVATRLAANARIWNTDNLFIVPSSIPPRSVVKFSLDANRQIDRMWVLTKAEIDRPDPKQTDGRLTPLPLGSVAAPLPPRISQ